MSGVREREIADALNGIDPDLRNCDAAWTELVTDYFSGSVSSQNESELDEHESDFDSNITDDDPENETSDGEDGNFFQDIVTPVMGKVNVEYVHDQNMEELRKISDFKCQCKYKHDSTARSCIQKFPEEDIFNLRMTMAELESHEKDLVLLSKLDCTINNSLETASSKRASQSERQRQRTTYFFKSEQICRDSFKFMHCISQNKLTGLLKFYKEKGGLEPRPKRGKRSHNFKHHLTVEDVKSVVTFLENYAEANALSLPGRVPGFKRTDLRLLPCFETKVGIHQKYKTAMEVSGKHSVKISSFKNIWSKYVPFITVAKPMTDLCWVCQKYSSKFQRSGSWNDCEKTLHLQQYMNHLTEVQEERSYYQQMKKQSKDYLPPGTRLSSNPPCSREIVMHYSFDYAQQVHYPSDPLQPGPIYFLTPRKCGIFGIHCEAIPQQVNYLIDEGMETSKGSSSVISFLHHFFNSYGLGETVVHLHCDNCSGQNKNRFVLWYFCWRVLQGLHKEVTLNFLIAGHTKFAPDWCFGLIKQKFRKTPVSCLKDIADVVTSSTQSGVNLPQLVGTESGQQFVPFYDWNSFLSPYFQPLPGIHDLQHFRFSADSPGTVFYRQSLHSEEKSFLMLKKKSGVPPRMLPPSKQPPGLSVERKTYLFNKIREFCRDNCKDVTCPAP